MYKLIIADLKVLGHRLWIIPLGVIIIVLSIVSIIALKFGVAVEYHNNFIFVPIITALLSMALMSSYDKNNTLSQIVSLPCSKFQFVIQKYIMFIIFFLLGAVLEFVVASFINIFNDENLPVVFFQQWNVVLLASLWVLVFLLPLYFKLREGKKAFLFLIAWIGSLAIFHVFLTGKVGSEFYEIENTVNTYTIVLSVTLLATVIYYLVRKKVDFHQIAIVPVIINFSISSVLFAISIFHLTMLNLMYYFSSRFHDYAWYSYFTEKLLGVTYVHGFVTILTVSVMYFLSKKAFNKKVIKSLLLLVIFPSIIVPFEYHLSEVLKQLFDIKHNLILAQYIVFIPLIIISVHYSKKFLTEGE